MRFQLKFVIVVLNCFAAFAVSAGADPRLDIDEVRACVEVSKLHMRSSEYSGQENEQQLIGACRDADPDCVKEAGESYHPSDSGKEKAFLEIIRACQGRGMGKCFRHMKESVASYNRRELPQILELLQKCK